MEFALANGITHSPSGELPRNRNYTTKNSKLQCTITQKFLHFCAKRRGGVAPKKSHALVRKVRKVLIGERFAAEASENHFRRIASQNSWFADILSAKEKLAAKNAKIAKKWKTVTE